MEEYPQPKYLTKYSGPKRSGVGVCGHPWDEHHLGVVLREEYRDDTGEAYIPEECEHFGFNEMGGLDAYGKEHCWGYRDSMLPDEHN